jgi:hypothetical protein
LIRRHASAEQIGDCDRGDDENYGDDYEKLD